MNEGKLDQTILARLAATRQGRLRGFLRIEGARTEEINASLMRLMARGLVQADDRPQSPLSNIHFLSPRLSEKGRLAAGWPTARQGWRPGVALIVAVTLALATISFALL